MTLQTRILGRKVLLFAAMRACGSTSSTTSDMTMVANAWAILPTVSNAHRLGTADPAKAGSTWSSTSYSSSAVHMVQNRGLEVRRESATPTEGDMTLYCKAGPDGVSIGDCPFCHFVRLVLEEKGLEYELQPATAETKPSWLLEHYEGKMPALRHGKECYVESDVIADYLEFFFPKISLQPTSSLEKESSEAAAAAVDGFFPAMARYLKHTPDGDDEDVQLRDNLAEALAKIEVHLSTDNKTFLLGDDFSLEDCKLAPKLYHMVVGLQAFKQRSGIADSINVKESYPAVQKYMDAVFARASFQASLYPASTVEWGWGNARK